MKFYCTAGRGTETFLGKELRDMFKEKLLEVNFFISRFILNIF